MAGKAALLKKKATENTNIKKKSSGAEETLKSGNPLDNNVKQKHSRVVGMSKGVTKNMENYESLRVDVWLSDEIAENETPAEALQRIEAFIDKALEEAVYNTIGE